MNRKAKAKAKSESENGEGNWENRRRKSGWKPEPILSFVGLKMGDLARRGRSGAPGDGKRHGLTDNSTKRTKY